MAITSPHNAPGQKVTAPWGEYVIGVGPMSVEAFAQLSGADGWLLELYQGRLLRMPGPGYDHAAIQSRLFELVNPHLRANTLGRLVGTGYFVLSTGEGQADVLCPDLSYTQPERLAQAPRRGSYPVVAPDLVVEIVSPTDRLSDVAHKTQVYLVAGVRLIWVIWPVSQTIEVWRSATPAAPV
ncbi:MAG TPA: Uma2 family endonuclease, partial [Ktedonobacterales bacterium]|nr:Uma2 family endonuclease [Ktedonobacterales bacterium]